MTILLLDVAFAAVSLWAAFELRFDRGPADITELEKFQGIFTGLLLTLAVSRLVANVYFSLHRWSFKFSSLRDGARIVMASIVGSVGFVALSYFFFRDDTPPRGVVALEFLLTTAWMASVRFAPRLLWMYRADLLGPRRGAVRTLVAGAGASGETLLRDLSRSPELSYHVVGFVDDDRARWGHIVGGKPILGGLGDLPRLVKTHRVEQIIIAIPRLAASRLREILSLGFSRQVRFKILPSSYGALDDRDPALALQDVSPEDLLARAELTFDHDEKTAPKLDPTRSQLVAGAAGSIGSEVCAQLLELGCGRLVMVDTDENGLYTLKRRFERIYPERDILAEVADIRDLPRIRSVFNHHRPSDVFHAAARKHVPLMEAAPGEAVKTNVFGTEQLARLASAVGAERFVYMSTDKAVRATSVMGATKRLGEMVVRRMDEKTTTRFSVVRFGNVLGSAGSVVPLFREQIAGGGPVTVTHPDIQRYFMTISEAVGLVLRAAYGDHGGLCVLEMGEPIRILDLARQMITMAGLVPDVDIDITFTGLRPGEKLFEELLADDEEVLRLVDRKIRVVSGADPPEGLDAQLELLRQAVAAEDAESTISLLHELVPDFHSFFSGPGSDSTHPQPTVVM